MQIGIRRFGIVVIGALAGLVGCSAGLRKSLDVSTPYEKIVAAGQAPHEVWEIRSATPVDQILDLNPGQILVSTLRGEIYAIGMADGRRVSRIWQPFKRPLRIVKLDNSDSKALLYSPYDKKLFAFELGSTRVIWKRRLINSGQRTVVNQDTLWMLGARRQLIGLSRATGKTLVRRPLPHKVLWGIGSNAQQFYYLRPDGVFCFTDRELQVVRQIALGTTREVRVRTDRQQIQIADSGGRLWVIDPHQLRICWQRTFSQPVFAPTLCAAGVIIVAQADGLIHGLNYSDGNELWSYQGEGLCNAEMTVCGDVLIIPFARGRVVALRASDGGFLWEIQTEHVLRSVFPVVNGLITLERGNTIRYWKFGDEP